MVEPSVLTTSGSSIPGSWLLVVENEVPPAVVPAFSPGAAAWGARTEGDDAASDGSVSGRGEASGTPWVIAKCVRS